MAQNLNRNSDHAEIIKNAVDKPGSIKSSATTARNDGDEPFESAPRLIGEGTVASKSFNQSAENDAFTNVKEQQALNNSDALHEETRISSEELLETNKFAQRLCRKRKFSEVAGASDVEEPVS
jgi:hypothetical protein